MIKSVIEQPVAECNLFGEGGFVVQLLLGVISFLSLVGKRYLDKEPRPWKVWAMDTSKQAISAGTIHLINLAASYQIDQYIQDSNQCVWYFLNLLLDNIFGMGLCYLLLKFAERLFDYSDWLRFVSGFYGNPPSSRQWLYQLHIWLCVCGVMKVTVLSVVWVFHIELSYIGDAILSPISKDPVLELYFVMIIIPLVLNALMFWVTDTFLQIKHDDSLNEDLIPKP